jgi:TatD DNase family protein
MTAPPVDSPIVDTHLHLDEPAFDADRDEVLRAARTVGVTRFINIGHVPERWESSRILRERHPDVDIVIGVHPQHADDYRSDVDLALRTAVREMDPVAIGETGFDFYRAGPSREAQERAFAAQIMVASDARLPVVIHQRSGEHELIAMLDRFPDLAPIVLHSFDGTDRLADWAIERGCFIGIGGLATKRSAEALRGTLQRFPPQRLLLETDSPYLAPPGTGDRRNAPSNLPRIAALLAPLWDLARDELCQVTSANANAVFGPGRAEHRPL